MMLLTPDRYAEATLEELLTEAALGRVGVDQAWAKAIVEREPEETARELAAFYLDMDEEVRIDLGGDIFHLLRALRSVHGIPVYVELLQDAGDEDVSDIYEALSELGAAAVEPLLEIHAEAGPDSQALVEFLLAGLRVEDERITALLAERLRVDPTEAAISIGQYGSQALRGPVEEALAALDSADGASELIRRELQFALEQIESKTVKDDPPPFAYEEQFLPAAYPVFDVLEPAEMLAFLDHPDGVTRRMAVESLGNEVLDGEQTARLLAAAESDAEESVRAQAWQALAVALEDPEIHAKLEEKFLDETAPAAERAAAACALAEGDLSDELLDGLDAFYEDPATRALALKAMWHSMDQRFAERFPPHLEDADRQVQREAIWGAGYLGIGHAAGTLERLFADPDAREHALYAYALSCPGDVSRGRAKGIFKKIFDLAGGLSAEEVEIVESAIDQRLSMHGLDPVFHSHHKAH